MESSLRRGSVYSAYQTQYNLDQSGPVDLNSTVLCWQLRSLDI
jgi:hypothetical protein